MFFQGHFADPPPMPQKNPPKSFTKKKPDYLAFIEKKKVVTHLDIARQFLMTTQTARIVLVELEKQGKVARQAKESVHDKDVFLYVEGI